MRIALRKKSNHHRRSADLPLLFLLSISIFVFVYLPPRVDRSKSNPRHRQCCVVFNNSGTEKKIVKQSKRANDKKKPTQTTLPYLIHEFLPYLVSINSIFEWLFLHARLVLPFRPAKRSSVEKYRRG